MSDETAAATTAKENVIDTADLKTVMIVGRSNAIMGYDARTTKSGIVAFFGTDLISPKVINFICAHLDSLDNPELGLHAVHFRMDGHPQPDNDDIASWMFLPDSRSAVCNLKGCFDLAVLGGLSEDVEFGQYLNPWYGAWLQIVQNFLHEAHHANAFSTDREALEGKDEVKNKAAEEEAACAYASKHIIEMAKIIDLEPDFPADIAAWFSARLLDEIEMLSTDPDNEPTAREQEWLDLVQSITLGSPCHTTPATDDKKTIVMSTLREYLRVISDNPDDEVWKTLPAAFNGTGAVAGVAQVETIAGVDEESYILDEEDADAMNQHVSPVIAPGIGVVVGGMPDPSVAAGAQPATPQVVDTVPAATAIVADIPMAPAAAVVAPVTTGMPVAPGITPQTVAAQVVAPQAVAAAQGPYPVLTQPEQELQGLYDYIYSALAANIFASGGYQISDPATIAFPNFRNIATPLTLDPAAAIVLKAQTRYDGQGALQKEVEYDGWASGIVVSENYGLPGYSIVLNGPQGQKWHRKLMPQNPWKTGKDGQYTGMAKHAQAGNNIVWIIDEDSGDFILRIYNNVIQWKGADGYWTAQ